MKVDGALPTAQIRLAYSTGGEAKALTVGRQFLELQANEAQLLRIARGEASLVGSDPMLYVEGTEDEQALAVAWCRVHRTMPVCHYCGNPQPVDAEMVKLFPTPESFSGKHFCCEACEESF